MAVRNYGISWDLGWLETREQWPDLNLIGMVEAERHIGKKVSREKRYFVAGLNPEVSTLTKVVAIGAWRIGGIGVWM